MGQMRVRRTGPWVKISCPFSWVQFTVPFGSVFGSEKMASKLLGKKYGKIPDFARNQDFLVAEAGLEPTASGL